MISKASPSWSPSGSSSMKWAHENAILIHVTLIPYLHASGELKTKPTQAVRQGAAAAWVSEPDIIVCRSEMPMDQSIKDKIALFCNVPSSHVLQNLDVEYLV